MAASKALAAVSGLAIPPSQARRGSNRERRRKDGGNRLIKKGLRVDFVNL
jgi:hypothetical protein